MGENFKWTYGGDPSTHFKKVGLDYKQYRVLKDNIKQELKDQPQSEDK
jgi:hypothetical protein